MRYIKKKKCIIYVCIFCRSQQKFTSMLLNIIWYEISEKLKIIIKSVKVSYPDWRIKSFTVSALGFFLFFNLCVNYLAIIILYCDVWRIKNYYNYLLTDFWRMISVKMNAINKIILHVIMI